jgi:cation:H+ antiporter
MFWVVFQVIFALIVIVVGANIFVNAITSISTSLGIPAFILAIIIAPIATELPEKFNSVVWIKHSKDTLALGNITGAMVFQSSLIPALGILLTPWKLSSLALISGLLALTSASIILINIRVKKRLAPSTLIGVGFLYIVFLLIVVFSGGSMH